MDKVAYVDGTREHDKYQQITSRRNQGLTCFQESSGSEKSPYVCVGMHPDDMCIRQSQDRCHPRPCLQFFLGKDVKYAHLDLQQQYHNLGPREND